MEPPEEVIVPKVKTKDVFKEANVVEANVNFYIQEKMATSGINA